MFNMDFSLLKAGYVQFTWISIQIILMTFILLFGFKYGLLWYPLLLE